ncbi:MAG: hypothetical protein JWM99_3147 [Verrucomicrobiales bacterium]|nr:hypothetical protein [Verrucomicrobiales bacterium]
MSTVDQITAAIRGLSWKDREDLIARLPEILPEMDGDARWEQIIRDPRPRPALGALGDKIEAELRNDPQAFPEISEARFDRNT